MLTKEIRIGNIHDYYENSYAELVQKACSFSSEIHLSTGTVKVNAKSIMGMMSLGLTTGEKITIIADGSDEEAAIKDLEKYLTTE